MSASHNIAPQTSTSTVIDEIIDDRMPSIRDAATCYQFARMTISMVNTITSSTAGLAFLPFYFGLSSCLYFMTMALESLILLHEIEKYLKLSGETQEEERRKHFQKIVDASMRVLTEAIWAVANLCMFLTVTLALSNPIVGMTLFMAACMYDFAREAIRFYKEYQACEKTYDGNKKNSDDHKKARQDIINRGCRNTGIAGAFIAACIVLIVVANVTTPAGWIMILAALTVLTAIAVDRYYWGKNKNTSFFNSKPSTSKNTETHLLQTPETGSGAPA